MMPVLSRFKLAALPHYPLPLVLLAGCASLPDVGYLRERNLLPKQQPAIVGVRGEFPDRGKQALLDGMAAQVGSTDILTRHIVAEEAINDRVLVTGNKAEALLQRDLNDSKEISLGDWRRRGAGERVKEWITRLFAYWL